MKWNTGNKIGMGIGVDFSLKNHIPQPKLVETNSNKETFFENLGSFFHKSNNPLLDASFYLPTVGVTNLKLNEPTELIVDQATIFFKILDTFKIPYALFAGSSIGLLRNAKTLPFADDYDIIILNQYVPLLANAFKTLKKHGFKMVQSINPQTKQKTNGGCTVYSSVIYKYSETYTHRTNNINEDDTDSSDGSQGTNTNAYFKKSHFQCDIFFSYFDNNGFLRNNAKWGLYHGKNIHESEVLPFQRRIFDGASLPFFKNVAAEVYKCYGNIEACIIDSHNINVCAKYKS